MSWEKDIEELRARETLAEAMGGSDRVARQRAAGKLLDSSRQKGPTTKGPPAGSP